MSTVLPSGMIAQCQGGECRFQGAAAKDSDRKYHALFVSEEKRDEYRPKTFGELKEGFE